MSTEEQNPHLPDVILYTDGAAKGNPGPGGYGVLMIAGPHRKELMEGFRLTTNNRMELLAVIVGLETLKKTGLKVRIYTDSQYVANATNKGWLRKWQAKGWKDVKNVDLWQRYLRVAATQQVEFVWVRGHAGNPGNERADELSVLAATGKGLKPDRGYEVGN